jgi:hypothetical protein
MIARKMSAAELPREAGERTGRFVWFIRSIPYFAPNGVLDEDWRVTARGTLGAARYAAKVDARKGADYGIKAAAGPCAARKTRVEDLWNRRALEAKRFGEGLAWKAGRSAGWRRAFDEGWSAAYGEAMRPLRRVRWDDHVEHREPENIAREAASDAAITASLYSLAGVGAAERCTDADVARLRDHTLYMESAMAVWWGGLGRLTGLEIGDRTYEYAYAIDRELAEGLRRSADDSEMAIGLRYGGLAAALRA